MIREGLRQEGIGAFINPSRWITRVGMNLFPQGMIPWYYNTIVPIAEDPVKRLVFSSWHSVVGVAGEKNTAP